jgi:hypothetical protein
MTTQFNWQVVNMDRLTSDGFVVTVHYAVYANDDTYSASTYGTIGYTQQPDQTYTPYADLTQEQVVGWVQASLGKDNVEASLQGQIDLQKNPVQAAGVPWSAA